MSSKECKEIVKIDTSGIKEVAAEVNKLLIPVSTELSEIAKDMSKSLKPFIEMSEKASQSIQVLLRQIDSEGIRKSVNRWERYKKEYQSIHDQYLYFFRANGIIEPKDLYEFMKWMEECVYPDYSLYQIMEENDLGWHLAEFHNYKQIPFRGNKGWDRNKEKGRMQKVLNSLKSNDTYAEVRTINKDELSKYFKPQFKGIGNNGINYLETFLSHLQTPRSAKAYAQIALMCYSGGQMNSLKPKSFSEWYSIFSSIVGCERKKYDNTKKLHESTPGSLKNTFSYLE